MALPGPNEVVASLLGALQLLRRDRSGLNNFNMTEEGFWRSFFASRSVASVWKIMVSASSSDT